VKTFKARWRALSVSQRWVVVVVPLMALAGLVHQLTLYDWYIEDAAISFAYARNWANGEGLVAVVGGERIEGYSNPLWVFLLGLFELCSVNGFVASKILSGVFGVLTVVVVYLLARQTCGPERVLPPLLCVTVLAFHSQFAIWNAAGLENSLFSFLLAMGIWRVLVETDRDRRPAPFPWSALWFFFLAITRPEGIVYSAFGGLWFALVLLGRPGWFKRVALWLVVFFVPFGGYHYCRYQYFAWEFPNTYYAKMGRKVFKPFSWETRGWRYLRGFSHEVGHGYFLPLYVFAVIGWRRWRGFAVASIVGLLAVVLLYPGLAVVKDLSWWPSLPTPKGWVTFRVWTLLALALLVPLLGFGRKGWTTRVLCWGMAVITVIFTVRTMGDWMKGYRWMALLAVPSAVLFGLGLGDLAQLLRRWPRKRWVLVGPLLVVFIATNVLYSNWFTGRRETGPFSVLKRVNYTQYAQRKLHLEEASNLDVDMGAHVYWSKHKMIDLAGLVDVPMGHHNFQRPFIEEYLFKERKPTFAHVHGGWANTSKMRSHKQWRQEYFELPGYPTSKRFVHVGNHVRRDALMAEQWSGSNVLSGQMDAGLWVAGVDLPVTEVVPGKAFFVEVAMDARELQEEANPRVLLFVAREDQLIKTWSIDPGHDWLAPEKWRDDEVFVGRFSPTLPQGLKPGPLDLGWVVLQGDLAAADLLSTPTPVAEEDEVAALIMKGEVRLQGVLNVIDATTHSQRLKQHHARLVEGAAEGRCEEAQEEWDRLRARMTRRFERMDELRKQVDGPMATCWAERGKAALERPEQVAAFVQARRWDHKNPDLLSLGGPIADALFEEGLAARSQEDWQAAYERFSDVLAIDAQRSWARRYAEEARDHRLELDPASLQEKEHKRQERVKKMKDRRKNSSPKSVVKPHAL